MVMSAHWSGWICKGCSWRRQFPEGKYERKALSLRIRAEFLAHECEECVKLGAQWVHLRTCQACGVTLCCDSSPNRHASKHARSSGHPVVASAEPGERWLYCYPDDAYAEYEDLPRQALKWTVTD